jgi:hypothetical protein
MQKGEKVVSKTDWFRQKHIVKKKVFNNLQIRFSYRSSTHVWGRFGGGWNWKLGLQIGTRTVLVSLLICEISFTWGLTKP